MPFGSPLPARRTPRSASPRPGLVPVAVGLGIALGVATTGYAAAATATADVAPAPQAAPLSVIVSDAHAALDDARSTFIEAAELSGEVTGSGFAIDPQIDTAALVTTIGELSTIDLMPAIVLPTITERAEAETAAVEQRTAALRQQLTDAEAQRAAEEAAARAAAEAAAAQKAAEEAAAAQAAANTVDGAKATAARMASERYGWGGDQFSCLVSLWNKESSWDYTAYNPSGATGIPQSLPGSKMASAGADWQTNATTQIAWGLGYISSVYGSPCSAWGHSQATNWY